MPRYECKDNYHLQGTFRWKQLRRRTAAAAESSASPFLLNFYISGLNRSIKKEKRKISYKEEHFLFFVLVSPYAEGLKGAVQENESRIFLELSPPPTLVKR